MQYITRDDLYARVWREPMMRLAPSLGASGPALKELCLQAAIPLPGPGHWAKLRNGQAATPQPLPPRPPGARALIVFGRPSGWWRGPREMLADPVPPEPDFPESLDALAARLAGELAPLRKPSPIRPARNISAAAQRRLQVVADLRALLSQIVVRPKIAEDGPETYRADIHAAWLRFTLRGSGSALEPLSLVVHGIACSASDSPSAFVESDGVTVEARLQAVAVDLLVRAEAAYRREALRFYDARMESRREAEEDVRRRRQKALALIEQRRLDRQQARRDLLFSQANAWRTAQNIRGFVADVLATGSATPLPVELRTWAEWARREADDLDPVKHGRLTAPLEP